MNILPAATCNINEIQIPVLFYLLKRIDKFICIYIGSVQPIQNRLAAVLYIF